MKEGFFTKDSVFDEIKSVYNYLKESDLETENVLPAIVLLEKQLDGMNKHAIAGRPQEICEIFEWGISQYANQTGIPYEDVLKGIELVHKSVNHCVLQSEKE